ncbi:MAG TPA: GGDEF domain-containing protein, partial [Casimicrobium huifangae]|nr:GGDEF domain-containing protein [Casimicrobium huifangae]
QQGLYLLLLDIDHFKSINDSWGHAVGDAVLQRVARCVVGSIGEPRATGRFGGEEFVAWCRVDSRETMAALAARTLQAIRQSNWDEIGAGLRVTASLGWTAATRHASVDAALSEADRRMYDAKHAGRDQAMG